MSSSYRERYYSPLFQGLRLGELAACNTLAIVGNFMQGNAGAYQHPISHKQFTFNACILCSVSSQLCTRARQDTGRESPYPAQSAASRRGVVARLHK